MSNWTGFGLCLIFVISMDARGPKFLYWPYFVFLLGFGASVEVDPQRESSAVLSAAIYRYCYSSMVCVWEVGGILLDLSHWSVSGRWPLQVFCPSSGNRDFFLLTLTLPWRQEVFSSLPSLCPGGFSPVHNGFVCVDELEWIDFLNTNWDGISLLSSVSLTKKDFSGFHHACSSPPLP